MRSNSKISIIIPTYNRLSLLKKALKSVLIQTYTNWECIVVDDGSCDDTILEMKTLSRQDNRIIFCQRQNTLTGANICRNEGIIASTGKYIIFLDSDDCLAPFCLENRVKIMETKRKLDFAVFPCQLFKEKPGDVNLLWNANKSESDIDRFLKLDTPWQTASCIWRRKSLIEIGLWDERLLSWQDWEIHLRALIKGLTYEQYVTRPDCYWRMPCEETIGSKSISAEHLVSHETLFIKVQQLLEEHNLLNLKRKKLIAKLYFWLSERWLLLKQKDEALRVGKICLDRDLVKPSEYQIRVIYLKATNIFFIKVTRCIKKQVLKWFGYSKTFRNTPINPVISGHT